jgi:hypothetical protein
VEESGIDQIASLIVGHDPNPLALSHQLLGSANNGGCLAAPQEATDDM